MDDMNMCIVVLAVALEELFTFSHLFVVLSCTLEGGVGRRGEEEGREGEVKMRGTEREGGEGMREKGWREGGRDGGGGGGGGEGLGLGDGLRLVWLYLIFSLPYFTHSFLVIYIFCTLVEQ